MMRIQPSLLRGQRGVALPVMLIMLLVLLVTSIYLLRSSNSTTLTAANLAHDAQLVRAADFGLHTGFRWLSETAVANKPLLNDHVPNSGYRASQNTTLTVRQDEYWDGSREVANPADPNGPKIRYVIHRLCRLPTDSRNPSNACVQTTANTSNLGNTVGVGNSLVTSSPLYNGIPQIHYVITARIDGARGGNVITQMVVLLGA